jgi:hypothetical protein
LPFNFALEFAIRKFQESQVGLKLNGTHQLLVNLLGDNANTIKKITEALTVGSKVVGLKVNTEKTKSMVLSHHQNVGQNHNMR